ncbi:Transcription factor mst12 [Hypoxylon texense]
MATVPGKRKARIQKEKDEIAVSQEDAQAIFRRHFEAQFAPLEPAHTTTSHAETSNEIEDLRSDSEEEDDDANDSWDGVSGAESDSDASGDEAAEVVEVVTHTSVLPALSNDPLAKRESKAYLSSRIPSSLLDPSSAATSTSTKPTKSKAAADEDAPSLLKNDLALQRLLSESHLFSGPGAGSGGENGSVGGNNGTEHAGRNRHLATDLRLAALGSKASIYKQAKMPMAHRKGIHAAAEAREAKRRREARENGIVLERPAAAAAGGGKGRGKVMRRKRGGKGGDVGAPAVGRLQGGMLKLSRKDIVEIQGDDRRSGGRGDRKKRRR